MDIVSILDEKKVITDDKNYPLSTIRDMYDEGDLITNPDYQRDFIYDISRRSKLIESVLLGIPIPTVYLCQEDNEVYSVIDGQQRIMSFVTYLKNEYALKGLTEIPELNSKKYSELEKPVQRKLKNATIHAVCLLKESQELKYEIFSRLNQGAVMLKAQELRNCIYRGSFNAMLEKIATTNAILSELFCGTNKRKTFQERILRFFALRDFNNYKSSMPKTLNQYMMAHQNDSADSIESQRSLFCGTIDIIKQILGKTAFMQYDRNKQCYIDKFSPSVYDSIVIPFSLFDRNSLMRHADIIRNEIERIRTQDDEYWSYAESNTTSKSSVRGRIMKIYQAINSCMTNRDIDGERRAFTHFDKESLWHEGYVCSYCGNVILNINDAEVDHIQAFSSGGETSLSNAQLLHRHCNREKSAKEVDDWVEDEDDTE